MMDVDLRAVWLHGRRDFTCWFVPASLVFNWLFVRTSMRMPLATALPAGIGMTAAAWLAVCVWPISLLPAVLLEDYVTGRHGPFGWIFALLLSAAFCAAAALLVLRAFRQRITVSVFWVLAAVNLICVGIAVYGMVMQLATHPPEA